MKSKPEARENWAEQKSRLKQKIVKLTGNNLIIEDGKKEAIIGQLQIILGKTKEQVNAILAAL